jgi:hypothetical protein
LGHPPDEVWRMTPKRIDAMLFIARKRRNMEQLEELTVLQHARTDDKKTLSKFVRDLNQ